MSQTLIVLDDLDDWAPYYPSDQVISFADYLDGERIQPASRTRVINLCKRYRYLSDGYYCSLLAEARGHHVIPSVQVLNDLGKRALYQLRLGDLDKTLGKDFEPPDGGKTLTFRSFFGTTSITALRELARRLFEYFPCPMLEVTLTRGKQWQVVKLKTCSPGDLNDAEQDEFAAALDHFSHRVWRKGRTQKTYRYDLAVLVNEAEKLPPSNKAALKKFIKAGRQLGIDVELISQRDYLRLPEFDGLFIRETTAIDHHTYRFAKKAEAEGMVVIDDPTSILRCTNKIYLADLFRTHRVPTPRSLVLHKGNQQHIEELEATLGYPVVIKIPDGSFSRGIARVDNREQLENHLREMFRQSSLILAQEFLYTDYDWRIGILNNRPLYACRYYMVKDHWQIYHHGGKQVASGAFETLPTFEVPRPVIDTALAATRPIGNSLYGVDIKEKNGAGYVVEVNDNPSLDRGVEDLYLGDELYRQVMEELLRRMVARRERA